MAREKFINGSLNSNEFIGVLGIGSIICMFCVVFLGLKLKWFRAQIKFGDSHIKKNQEQSVQGLGFKLKSNPDDFQSYKLISEFSPITTPQYAINQTSRPNQLTKSESIPNINTASSSNIKKSSNLMSKSKSSVNLTEEPKEIKPKSKKSPKHKSATKIIEPLIALNGEKPTKNESTTNPLMQTPKHTTNNNPGRKIIEPLIAPNGKLSPKRKDMKSPRIQEQKMNTEKDVSLNMNQEATNSTLHIRNPLGTDRRSTKFDEDNWDINYVVENAKESKSYGSSNANSVYSSQAASIFFGGAQTYDSDHESIGSQTSA